VSLTHELTIPTDHPAYAGHFPGNPILPGVVLLDAALHAVERLRTSPRGAWQVQAAKFHSVVQPGQPLTLELEPAPDGTVRFMIRVAGLTTPRPVASGSFKLLTSPAESADGRRTR
jgi:3-hydroxymyristoyl/3-hydroxydecanoyl-(acyl carrier protein) dehydratase